MNAAETKKMLKDPEVILFITALLGSILYISLIFNDNLWVDEAFSASLIRGSWNEVVRDTVSDTLPPFYNFAGKLFTGIFGFSAPVLKLFSCIPMILLIFFGGKKISGLYGFRPAYLYELFLLSMPYFFHYAVEIRMYSWGIFSCGMAAVFFPEILSDAKKGLCRTAPFAWFTFFSVFSGYVHHFALISCAVMWFLILVIFSVDKNIRGLKHYMKFLAVFIILYLPCFILAVYQIKNASGYFSMSPLNIKSFLSDIRYPFVTHITVLSAVLMLAAFLSAVFGIINLLAKKDTDEISKEMNFSGLLLFSVLYLTLIFGYMVSFAAGKSIFTARYLAPSLSVLWLGIALLSDRASAAFRDNKFLIAGIIAVIAITGTVDYTGAFKSEYARGVENMKAFFDENLTPEDGYIIYENNYEIELCFRYYYPGLKKTDWEHADEISGNLWFFETDGFKKELDKADKYGYNPIYTGDFNFDRYGFSLYRLEKSTP